MGVVTNIMQVMLMDKQMRAKEQLESNPFGDAAKQWTQHEKPLQHPHQTHNVEQRWRHVGEARSRPS